MIFSNAFLKLNKIYKNPLKRYFLVNKNKKNFNFFILLLKLNILRKIIFHKNNKLQIILNSNIKLKFIFFSKKNQIVFINQKKLKTTNKINLYLYTTDTGLKSSLNCNKGGQIIAKVIL